MKGLIHFTHNDFNKKEFGLDLKPFNIRDILIYDKHTNDDKPYNGYINFTIDGSQHIVLSIRAFVFLYK